MMHPPPPIHHTLALSRFEAHVDGLLSVADYRLVDGVMHMTHTEVPEALQGQGIAAALVHAALAYAQANGFKVNPICSYVHLYMRRHPETQHLLAGQPAIHD